MSEHKEVPSAISQPLGALFLLDAAEQMIQSCRVKSKIDQNSLQKICRQLEDIRSRQLVDADKAFSEEIRR
jgi:hypothetical protein